VPRADIPRLDQNVLSTAGRHNRLPFRYSVVPVTAFLAIAFLIRRMRYGAPGSLQQTNHHGEQG
jgi:hypothetical protein